MKAFLDYIQEIANYGDTYSYHINIGTYGPSSKTINIKVQNAKNTGVSILCYDDTTKSYITHFKSNNKNKAFNFFNAIYYVSNPLKMNEYKHYGKWRFL